VKSADAILVLGSINTDLVLRGPRLPNPGETVIGGEFYRAAGGKGANQAVAAARAAISHRVTLLGAVGNDAFGHDSLAGFANDRINTQHIRVVPDASTGVALILVDDRGENLISVASGANATLTPGDVDALPDELFSRSNVFLVCLESPLATVEAGLRRASAHGLLTILNPAPVSDIEPTRALLTLVDILVPNRGEAAALAGVQGNTGADLAEIARRLQSLGCSRVVITLGSEGCLVVDDFVSRVPPIAVTPVDTTAAGDAFCGALAVALAEQKSLVDAARFATCAAAISVTRRGAQPSLPTRAEIDAMPLPPVGEPVS
jgi:ribokinase